MLLLQKRGPAHSTHAISPTKGNQSHGQQPMSGKMIMPAAIETAASLSNDPGLIHPARAPAAAWLPDSHPSSSSPIRASFTLSSEVMTKDFMSWITVSPVLAKRLPRASKNGKVDPRRLMPKNMM